MDKISIFNAKIYNNQFKDLLKGLINSQINSIVKDKYIDLIIDFIFFYFGIYLDKNLPGNKFENIKFKKLINKQKILFFIIEVILPFLIKILKLNKMKKVLNILNFIFFIKFLKNGKFIDLNDFIIKIEYIILNEKRNRFINSEYLNRNIIWQYLSNFLLLVLPILSNLNLFNTIKKYFLLSTFIGPLITNFKDNEKECQICFKNNIYNPHIMENCGCLFCYYCIKSNLNNKLKGNCPKCGYKDQNLISLIKI